MSESLSSTRVDTVLAERHGAVLLLTLNRPERLNAWSDDLESRYFELLAQAEDDPGVVAIVLTGAGRGFCAGADLQAVDPGGDGRAAVRERARDRSFPYTLRKPLIAAINGPAAGLGLVEALYCDVRFCTPNAKLTTAFARRGLVAEYGMSWMLPRLVGTGRSFDLLLSGRVVLGEEALAIGLVDRLAEPDALVDEAVAYAQDLAQHCSPTAMAVIKDQIRRDAAIGFDAAYATSNDLLHESLERPDVAEGVASYLERRPATFPPLTPRS